MPNEHLSAKEILSDLIGFNTVSSVSNLELIKYIEDYLGNLGLEPVRISNEDGTKANLYATIGPGDKAGIVLSGHTDVVPVTNQPWNTNPFELKRKTVDNKIRLYGRGTADMK
ncbi:MAG: M20/M25/M40 family metallo-hydrolase, partial [Alphaproteobacteria bacterium]|nr:M20/M25/M40 family metallo-hydrolase [Alphaproteobacteria bacterium]